MQYTLYENTGQGVLTDRTPVCGDVKDTYEVSFILPDDGAYIAIFGEEKRLIKNGACSVPFKLLIKTQYVELAVMKIDGDKVLRTYKCEPLKITSLSKLRQSQWEISGGASDKTCLDRLGEIEQLCDNVLARLKTMEGKCDAFFQKHEELYNKTVDAFGKDFASAQKACQDVGELLQKETEEIKVLAANFQQSEQELKNENRLIGEKLNEVIRAIETVSERLRLLEKNYDPTLIK